MFTFLHKRSTEKNHSHTEVFYNGSLIGYYIKNTSQAAAIDENYNFESYDADFRSFYASSIPKIKKRLVTIAENENFRQSNAEFLGKYTKKNDYQRAITARVDQAITLTNANVTDKQKSAILQALAALQYEIDNVLVNNIT